MVEMEGKISDLPVTVLIDPGASLSYISPGIVENVKLNPKDFSSHGWYSWPLELREKSHINCPKQHYN